MIGDIWLRHKINKQFAAGVVTVGPVYLSSDLIEYYTDKMYDLRYTPGGAWFISRPQLMVDDEWREQLK